MGNTRVNQREEGGLSMLLVVKDTGRHVNDLYDVVDLVAVN